MGVRSRQPLDGLLLAKLYTYVLAKLLQNGKKFMQKLTKDFKNYRNLDNSRQAVENPKVWHLMGYICLKTTLFHLKHYLEIYLILLSTTCVKIHQIPDVIFETISHFSRHNSSETLHTFDKKIPSKYTFSDFLLLKLKFIKLVMSCANLGKVFNVWPKKVQRSYLSWHWRVMQNVKKSWLVVWKMAWGI